MVFVQAWDETTPPGAEALALGDNRIRAMKEALRERLAVDHYFLASEAGDAKIGFHNKATFVNQASDPSALAAALILFAKEISGKSELHSLNEDGSFNQLTILGKLLITSLDIASAVRGDIILRDASGFNRKALGASGTFLKSDGTDLVYGLGPGNLGYFYGCNLSNSSGDLTNDIVISTGLVRDSANTYDLTLAAALTKQLDVNFAAGSNAGGLFTGAKANSTWYYVFLIRKDSDGTIDAGFDVSSTAANIPAGYTAYRCIGHVRTNGSGAIITFTQTGRGATKDYRYDGVNKVLDAGTQTNFTDVDCSAFIPPSSRLGYFQTYMTGGTDFKSTLRPNGSAVDDSAAASTQTVGGGSNNSSSNEAFQHLWVGTDSAQIIEYKKYTGTSLTIHVIGFRDEL